MDLDDQLSALAAGDLAPEEARAVRARVEADPALRQRLARHERLQAVLTGWEVPGMTTDQRAALDAAVTDALAALGDEPLVDAGGGRVVGLRPLRDDDREDTRAAAARGAAASAGSVGDLSRGDVTDLAAARERRRGIPSWVSGLVAAAAAVAVVGTVGVGLAGLGGDDADEMASDAMIAADAPEAGADGDQELDATDEMADDGGADDAAAAGAATSEAAVEADDAAAEESADAFLAAVVEPVVVEDLGSLDDATVGTVPAQVPPSLLEDAIGLLAGRAVPPDVLAEERALAVDVVRSRLPADECLDRSLAEVATDDLLLLVGYATFDGAPAVATVTLSPGGGDGTTPALVTVIRDEATCTVVAELISEP